MTYVLKFGRDPPPSLQLLPDEPLSPAHQQGLQQQLQGSPTQQHGRHTHRRHAHREGAIEEGRVTLRERLMYLCVTLREAYVCACVIV